MIKISINKLFQRLIKGLHRRGVGVKKHYLWGCSLLVFVFLGNFAFAAQPTDSTVTIILTGDVSLVYHFQSFVKDRFQYPFAKASWLKNADISVINLEAPLTTSDQAVSKKYIFKAPPNYAKILKAGGIDLADLANNHIYDFGSEGLLQTISALQKEGIQYIGAGRNRKEAHRPVIFKIKGLKIGFLAYYGVKAHEESHPATDSTAGTALRRLKLIKQDVKMLRPQVDFLIVLLHWGFEKEHYPRDFQIRFAHRVISYGVDLIVGHHPHVLQGVEKYKQGLVVYSLGNFVFGGKYQMHYQTAVLKVDIPAHNPKNWQIRFLPVQVDYWQPHLLQNAQADSVLKHIRTYSEIFEQTVLIR